jgi:hypothetical protein
MLTTGLGFFFGIKKLKKRKMGSSIYGKKRDPQNPFFNLLRLHLQVLGFRVLFYLLPNKKKILEN